MPVPDSAAARAHLSRPELFAAERRGQQWVVVGRNPSAGLTFFPVFSPSTMEGDFYVGTASATASPKDATLDPANGLVVSVLDAATSSLTGNCVWYGNGSYWQLVYCSCPGGPGNCAQNCTEPTGPPQSGQTVSLPCN